MKGQGPAEDELDQQPLKKMKKTLESKSENLARKTQEVLWSLANKVPSSRVATTAASGASFVSKLSSKSQSFANDSGDGASIALQELHKKDSLCRHLLLLDAAVDRHLSEQVLDLRETGKFAGVALASDESPPSQPRFRGLRFQITVAYLGTFVPVAEWEGASSPPHPENNLLGGHHALPWQERY